MDPDLRESLDFPCDIPGPISWTINEFKNKFPIFDYSFVDLEATNKDLWFLENLDEE